MSILSRLFRKPPPDINGTCAVRYVLEARRRMVAEDEAAKLKAEVDFWVGKHFAAAAEVVVLRSRLRVFERIRGAGGRFVGRGGDAV